MTKKNPQEAHYKVLHDPYERHYYDATSMEYRHRFIYGPLFEGLQLNNASVADLACGSGHNSLQLKKLFPGVTTTGYDISEMACRDYKTRTGNEAHQVDLTKPFEPKETYDAVIIIGGVHHCVADLKTLFANIGRMVRPGGYFMMMEPSDEFFLSNLRRLWYDKDKWFEADSEAALRHDDIAQTAAPYFQTKSVQFFGGPAFYLILNSLITRVPVQAKPYIAPLLFPLETLYNRIPGRGAYAAFRAVWQRTETPVE